MLSERLLLGIFLVHWDVENGGFFLADEGRKLLQTSEDLLSLRILAKRARPCLPLVVSLWTSLHIVKVVARMLTRLLRRMLCLAYILHVRVKEILLLQKRFLRRIERLNLLSGSLLVAGLRLRE